jgi:hypothetical protein
METHDLAHLFFSFWWLIFPLFWMIAALLRMNQRHDHTNKVLDLIRSYADQGKEVPPELLRALDQPVDEQLGMHGTVIQNRHTWLPVFLFAGLTAGFLLFAFWPGMDWDRRQVASFVFVAVIMAALCLGNLMAVLRQERRRGP